MITIGIIVLTSLISVLAFSNDTLFGKLLLSPYMVAHRRQAYRLLSHGLVHADWMHLLVNMFVLLSFGRAVEQYFSMLFGIRGLYYFLLLYTAGLLFGALPSFIRHKDNVYYQSVGASGAIAGVLFASILIQPLAAIRFVFIPVDIPAFIFGVLYLVYSAWMSKKGNDNIGHDAHFWGAVAGFVFTLLLKPSLILSFFNNIAGYFSF